MIDELKELKEACRKRDGYRCTICGMTKEEHLSRCKQTLQVHRVHPGEEYKLDNCVTLCRWCHAPQPKTSGTVVAGFYAKGSTYVKRTFDETPLQRLRLARGLSRSRLETRSGVTAYRIQLLEKKNKDLTTKEWKALAKVFEMDADAFRKEMLGLNRTDYPPFTFIA